MNDIEHEITPLMGEPVSKGSRTKDWIRVEDQFEFDFIMAVLRAKLGGRYKEIRDRNDHNFMWIVRIGKRNDKLGRKLDVAGWFNLWGTRDYYVRKFFLDMIRI